MGRELASRAATRNGRGQQNGGQAAGAPEEEAEAAIGSLKSQIEKMAPEYQKAMPKGREAAQIVRDAITCLRNVRGLGKCEPVSVLGALMTCAQLDLRPGVLGHAWPLPFYDKHSGQHRAQLVIGYQGYIELGHRSGRLKDITPGVVYWEDRDFDYWKDENGPHLIHAPLLDGMREKVRSFYSMARLVNGGVQITEPTSLAMMEAHRDRYAPRGFDGKVTGPWKDHFTPMGRKTTLIQLFRTLPKSAEMAVAMDADDGVRVDLNPEADITEVTERPAPRDTVPGEVVHDDAPPPGDREWYAGDDEGAA